MADAATCALCGGTEPRRNGYCASCDRDRQAAAGALSVGAEERRRREVRYRRLAHIYAAAALTAEGAKPIDVLRAVGLNEPTNGRRARRAK
jgi:hypothetical protein